MQTLLLCIKIFFARIIDVSIGVIRTVELVKDNTLKAVMFAFFEVLIWFIVAKEALSSNVSIIVAIFYSLGYSCGTLLGSYLSKKLIKGNVSIQVISSNIKLKDIKYIKSLGYGITKIDIDNKKKMLLIEVNNNELKKVITNIKNIDKSSFITVSDIKYLENGYIK